MMIMWLAYSLVIGALIAVAATLGERVALAIGWTTRYVWVAAMLLMMGSALGSLGWRAYAAERATADASVEASATVAAAPRGAWWESLVPGDATAAGGDVASVLAQRIGAMTGRLARFDRTVFVAWALLSTFVGALVLHATLEGRRLLQACEAREMKGVRVLVTDAMGPAAVGMGAAVVLLPRWALELEDQLLDLVLRHEQEHLRANDPTLLFLGLVLIVLLPWQLPLWWAWQRLRLAIEVDCDARLLRRQREQSGYSDTRRYAQLLLLMSQRMTHPATIARPLITMAAPMQPELSHLATRIQIMTRSKGRQAFGGVALLVCGMAATASVAFAIPLPRPSAMPQVAAPVQGDGRAIVRVTSVGMRDVEVDGSGKIKGEILIYATGDAKLGLGTGALRPLKDTLHLKAMPAFSADVTNGEVHIKLVGSDNGEISLAATVSGGSAKSYRGEAAHLVLMKGGAGIRTLAKVAPLFFVDGVKTTEAAAMEIPKDSLASVEVLKGEAASARYGAAGGHGVVLMKTKRAAAPDVPAAPTPSAKATDSASAYYEFQVEEPARFAAGTGRPLYPAVQRAAGVEATVLAQFIVGTDGLVEPGSFRAISGTMLSTEGKKEVALKAEHEYSPFELAVRDCLPTLRFTPGKRGGVPVRQVVQMPYVFAIAKK